MKKKIINLLFFIIGSTVLYYLFYKVFGNIFDYYFIEVLQWCVYDEFWWDCFYASIKSNFFSWISAFILVVILNFSFILWRNYFYKEKDVWKTTN